MVRVLPSLPEQEITKHTAEKLKMHHKEAKWELGNLAFQQSGELTLINRVYFIFFKADNSDIFVIFACLCTFYK